LNKYMNIATARVAARDVDGIAREIGEDSTWWRNRCHEISLKILRTGKFGWGRIARGYAPGVMGQHSWIVLGKDVYAPDAVIVDPTRRPGLIIVNTASRLGYIPRGAGRISDGWKRPLAGKPVALDSTGMSPAAKRFLREIGPMDYQNWAVLASGPVGGWPSSEIISAMADRDDMKALVPIDTLGHLTDRNPKGLYR
jgi:hypothetical protein